VLVREGTVPTAWDRQVRASGDVATLMWPLVAGLDREQFWVLLLNGKNRAIGLNLVSVGALTAALVHPREVMKPAILSNAAAIVLVHNHPSGDPAPSAEDLALTQRLWAAGELLGIRVLDHVVVGDEGAYCSLADQGALGGTK
jgi:DNA repair protein RadC